MIKKIIKTHIDAKYSFIRKMSQSEKNSFMETEFLDDGTIKCKIKSLKNESKEIEQNIELMLKYDKRDSYQEEKLKEFMKRKSEICFSIAFLASNNLNNLEGCEAILKNLNTDFKLCIIALKFYKDGEEQKAFEAFYTYFKDKNVVLDHYLINKIYGLLLNKYQQYKMASMLLRKAVEKRPEDVEIHKTLKSIYSIMDMKQEEKIEHSILQVLGG